MLIAGMVLFVVSLPDNVNGIYSNIIWMAISLSLSIVGLKIKSNIENRWRER